MNTIHPQTTALQVNIRNEFGRRPFAHKMIFSLPESFFFVSEVLENRIIIRFFFSMWRNICNRNEMNNLKRKIVIEKL